MSRKDDLEQATRKSQDRIHQDPTIARDSEGHEAKARARARPAEPRERVQGSPDELDAVAGEDNQGGTAQQESTPPGPGGTGDEGDRRGRVVARRPIQWFVYSLLSFAVSAVVVLFFLRPLRCLIEHRIIEAQVALIVALAGAIGAMLLKLVVGRAQRVLLGLLGGIIAALLLGVMVAILLPPLPVEECAPTDSVRGATDTPAVAITLALTSTPALTPVAASTPTYRSTPQAVATRIRELDYAAMVYVPAGEFWMGGGEYVAEKPRHKVYLDAFWIDRTEVTNAQYAQCVQATVCDEPGEVLQYSDPDYADHPVVFVAWSDADTFCRWVGGHLPSEAEWEKAAGWDDVAQQTHVYPWGSEPPTCERAQFYRCPPDGSVPVGSTSPAGDSPYGAADMAGNVTEWVADWYDRDYYMVSPGDNPAGPESGEYKVTRGGGQASTPGALRVVQRGSLAPETRYEQLGFRCVDAPGR